ncbi:hypothetical protein GVN24_24590 [Rhizobium sp. CRIBSB]|nr:hypothetical protein [Rhizobium sp. CRIBSB]
MTRPASLVITASSEHRGRLYLRLHGPDGRLIVVGQTTVMLPAGSAWTPGQTEVLIPAASATPVNHGGGQ